MHPHSDVDALFTPTITPVPTEGHVFRPRWIAVAAASVVLIGGSAFAMERVTNDPPTRVVPADSSVTETTHAPKTTEPTSTTIEQVDAKPVKPSVAKPVLVPDQSVPKTEPTVPVTEPTVPPTEPPKPPVVVEFTAKLGTDGRAKTPMKQGFYGTAQPGSVIVVSSHYGVADTVATAEGTWKTTLTMYEVPDGAVVDVWITSSTSERVREFTLERPVPKPPSPPETIEFNANLGEDGQAKSPMKQGFYGKAQPGSAIRVGSDWGVAETVAGDNGKWETTLVMPEVPPGTIVAVRVTSNTSDKVFEFTLKRPDAQPPTEVDFTANAASDDHRRTDTVQRVLGYLDGGCGDLDHVGAREQAGRVQCRGQVVGSCRVSVCAGWARRSTSTSRVRRAKPPTTSHSPGPRPPESQADAPIDIASAIAATCS